MTFSIGDLLLAFLFGGLVTIDILLALGVFC